MQRVLTTLSHNEPDRVPLFLLLTMHGAKELGMSIKDIFRKANMWWKGKSGFRKSTTTTVIILFSTLPLRLKPLEEK